ncbi:GAF and ANTAR domain-containing protein [Arthrobacter halodurans]|uniref:GAF and ANTAR domain-containing protein n=1 Tax=Arthrobacter halodurans TaxID=516699 RepID=A0ABV4UM03_9MICC
MDTYLDLILNSGDVEEFLADLARHTVSVVAPPGAEVLCGITLLRDNNADTIASSSDRARLMDEIQYRYGDGPCLRAVRTNVPVLIPDLQAETRWPEYTSVVAAQGLTSILAVPLALEGDAVAGLNLYAGRLGVFDEDAVRAVQRVASHASKALRLAVRMALHREEAEGRKAAMESRTIIDMAVGVLIGQNRCSQEDAVQIMKRAASHRNLKLRDIATQIVFSASGAPPTTHFHV